MINQQEQKKDSIIKKSFLLSQNSLSFPFIQNNLLPQKVKKPM